MRLDSDTMTATERVLATLAHEEPDRCPIFLMGIPPYSRTYLEWQAREEEIMDAWTENEDHLLFTPLGDYTLRYFFGTEFEAHGVGIQPRFHTKVLDEHGNEVTDPDEKRRLTSDTAEGRKVDYLGRISGWKLLETGHRYTWYVDGYLKTKQAVLDWYGEHGWPHEQPVRKLDVEHFQQFRSQFGDRIYMAAQIGGVQLYESAWPIMGQLRWAYYSRKDPDLIHRIIDSRKQAQLKILDELKRVRPEIIFGGDDLGQKGRAMVSPKWFDKFLAEPYTEIFTKIHEEIGAKIFQHSCGYIVDLLPNFIECGLDGWQSLEVAADIDHARVKKKFGDDLFFVGAVDSSRELCFGTPDSISAHVHDQIRAMGRGGGYVPGPAHDYLNVPLENALALRDAVHAHGKYPL